jgi:hypothetical protein
VLYTPKACMSWTSWSGPWSHSHGGVDGGPLFPLGQVVSRGRHRPNGGGSLDPAELLRRHQSGDWGDFDAQDRRQNHYAVSHRPRIFSSYGKPPDRLWVITEADCSLTTVVGSDED